MLIGLDFFVFQRLLGPGQSHLLMLAVGVAGVVAFSLVIFANLTALHERISAQNERLTALTDALQRRQEQLQALNSAAMSLSAELATGKVLQRVVELARSVTRARYAALGTFDDDGNIEQFLTAGISEEERRRIGDLPKGRGILGLLQRVPHPLRLRDLTEHPASAGFPPNHPPMRSFLGAPILWRGRSLGNIYLTEKEGAAEFDEADEAALLALAAHAAVAIENARLYEQVGRISVLEERHRIGMDLHDGAIQSLYGIGLLVEDAAERLTQEPAEATRQLRRAVDRLNAAIADLRTYVLGLRQVRAGQSLLSESLPAVAEQVRTSALLDVQVEVAPEADERLDPRHREQIFFIATDALGNIARHARARHATLRLYPADGSLVLEVSDDGVGFDPDQATEGHGLVNMRQRAFALGGRLQVESRFGGGTRIRFKLPDRGGQ